MEFWEGRGGEGRGEMTVEGMRRGAPERDPENESRGDDGDEERLGEWE